ncbi:GIY-YIG nuclease family protein [Mesorhizobium sp. CA13]|uniref:GIY-YIG nuclease family protein n=1 Tax=Mesorhizobium sp. CA13 TaxID=2876643 RepID=UPI001CCA8CCF|nr:GIY-YIG nuclease family protein [Mesorhizobium sp. CA13]MBZ9852691.1 GIY-YIG nuclease family protein [Mesorhizobium sp. CA13]
MWYVYFLLLRNGDTYVGSTNDFRRRLESHRSGDVTSTKAYLPVILKTYIAVETGASARQLERYFKTGSGKAFASKRFWRTARR